MNAGELGELLDISGDVTQQLEDALQRWLSSIPQGIAEVRRRTTRGGCDQFEVLPREPDACRILIHGDDEPGRFKLYLGEGTWWDRIPLDDSIVERICDAVAEGRFTEHARVWRGRILTTRGRLELSGGHVWVDHGSSSLLALLPIGTITLLGYAPYRSGISAA